MHVATRNKCTVFIRYLLLNKSFYFALFRMLCGILKNSFTKRNNKFKTMKLDSFYIRWKINEHINDTGFFLFRSADSPHMP